jgi:ATP-dependent helicase/nuclease subunit A
VSDEEFTAVRQTVTHLLRPLLKVDDETLALVLEAATPFVEEYRETYLRRGLVNFDGLLALCRDLLRDHPDVRERTKERFRMVLVDEFQDTDPLQHEIVLFLAERPGGGARAAYLAQLDPGRLFVVGDAKQSIYRFRGADYGAYRLAIRRVVETGGETLYLVGNFRAVPGLIEPANRVFEAIDGCWRASDYQPEYVPIEAVRDQPDDDPRVELWTVEIEDDTKADERRRRESQVLADAIHTWVEKERRCGYRQITMLFRAFAPITHYLRALRAREIPFVVDGGKDFLSRPEVGQLMATFRTLSQPSDPPALLAYLRSAAASVPDTELAAYAESGGGWDWRSDANAERFPRIASGFVRLRQISDEIRHLPADAAVRVVLERTLLLPLGAIAFEGPQRVANLRKLTAAAAELARDGRLSLEQVVEGLEKGELEDIKTDRPLSDDAAEAIRITSIHRMKGLENDWIILPDLARERRWGYERPEAIKAVHRPDGRPALAMRVGGMSNSTDVWYGIEHERHDEAEETRVLYVALTRARERLVVLVAPKERAPGVRALAPWGYDPGAPPPDGALLAEGRVLHRVRRAQAPLRSASLPVSEDAKRSVERYEAAVQAIRQAATPPLASPSGLHEETQDARDSGRPPFATQSRDLAKGVGIVVHRLLEGWGGADPELLERRLPRACKEAAEQLNLPIRALKKEVTAVFAGFTGSRLIQWLDRIEQLGTELPVIVRRDDGRAYRGSIDLLYRDPEGQLVVADYKTDREVDHDQLREKYEDQLGVYAEAVAKACGLDTAVRAELWVLRTGERLAVG